MQRASRLPSRLLGRAGLYAIADADASEQAGLSFVDTALAMLDADLPLVQLRAKNRTASWFVEVVEAIVDRVPGSNFLVVNDRADVAQLAGAYGVHVGQSDLPPSAVRQLYPEMLVGYSTHGIEQLSSAFELGLDYVALGPVFSTRSKKNAEPEIGWPRFCQMSALAREAQVPLVAIGGICDENFHLIAPHCDLFAAIATLLPETAGPGAYSKVTRRCRQLQERFLYHR